MPKSERLLTLKETAEYLRLTPGALYTQRYRGEKPGALGIHVGRKILYRTSDIDEFEGYMASVDFRPLTSRTITCPNRFREVIGDIRHFGYSIVDQELEDGVRSAAAPIIGRYGHSLDAIGLTFHAVDVPLKRVRKELSCKLTAAAHTVS